MTPAAKRPTYLQLVAPHAARRGAGMLTPPRLLFRPGIAPDIMEAAATPAMPGRPDATRAATPETPPRASQTAVSLLAPAPPLPATAPASAPNPAVIPGPPRAAAAALIAAPIAARPVTGLPDSHPARQTPCQNQVDAPAPDTPRHGPVVQPHSLAPGSPPQLASPRAPGLPARDSAAQPRPIPPPSLAPTPSATPGTAASLAQIAAAAQRASPEPPASESAPALTAIAQPAAKPAETTNPAGSHPPAPTLTPPPSPPPRPPRERATTGLHIGTLEIRVSPPAPASAPTRPTPRPAHRAAAAPRGRLARGFGVFGLGQS